MRRIEGEDLPYPWEIRYFQWQMRWLLKPGHWNLIKENQWPFSIQDDAMKSAGVSHHAAFEMISLVKAEIEARLESVGPKDGDMCMARYYNEYEDERIARMFNIPYWKVAYRIKRAMIYMAGRRKRVSYDRWIANGWNEIPKPPKSARPPNGGLRNFSYGNMKTTISS